MRTPSRRVQCMHNLQISLSVSSSHCRMCAVCYIICIYIFLELSRDCHWKEAHFVYPFGLLSHQADQGGKSISDAELSAFKEQTETTKFGGHHSCPPLEQMLHCCTTPG